jgi:hypothetical protein
VAGLLASCSAHKACYNHFKPSDASPTTIDVTNFLLAGLSRSSVLRFCFFCFCWFSLGFLNVFKLESLDSLDFLVLLGFLMFYYSFAENA